MPRQTESPRLADLRPDDVADDVLRLVAAHVAHLATALSPCYQLGPATEPRSSDLWLTAHALARYAQTGEDAETSDPAVAAEYARDRCQEVCAALYSQAGRPGTFEAPDLDRDDEGDPTSAVGCALLGAWTRAQIASVAAALEPGGVAVLASVGHRALRLAVEQGILTRQADRRIPTAQALAWLRSRGVRGL